MKNSFFFLRSNLYLKLKKKKKKKGSLLEMIFFCYFYSLSHTKSIDIFWICIHRDWRDSNPQLPPWQGGALTNWTTIPGKKSYSIHTYSYNFIQTLCFSIWDSKPCTVTERGRLILYIDIFMGLHFSEIDTDYSQSVPYC